MNNAEHYRLKGVKHREMGNYEKALKFYKKALELEPNNARVYYNRGIVYWHRGELEKAIEEYTRAIKIRPTTGQLPDAGCYYLARAIIYKKLNPNLAIKDYRRVLKLRSDNWWRISNRWTISNFICKCGDEYSKNNNFKSAIACYSWAIALNRNTEFNGNISLIDEINPKSKYLNKRGMEYLKNCANILAIEDFNRSIEMYPNNNPKAYEGWAESYFGQEFLKKFDFSLLTKKYRDVYNLPEDWPETEYQNDFKYAFEDIWIAVNSGGNQTAIDYVNSGLFKIKGFRDNREEAINNFKLAVDSDIFLNEILTSKGNDFYIKAKDEIKYILNIDICHAYNSKNRFTLSLGDHINNYSYKLEYKNKPQRFINPENDKFYLSLLDFYNKNGKKVFDNKYLYGMFSDFINGEHKKDLLLFKQIIEADIHKKLPKLNGFLNSDMRRMADIIHYLFILQSEVEKNKRN